MALLEGFCIIKRCFLFDPESAELQYVFCPNLGCSKIGCQADFVYKFLITLEDFQFWNWSLMFHISKKIPSINLVVVYRNSLKGGGEVSRTLCYVQPKTTTFCDAVATYQDLVGSVTSI